MKRTLTIGCAAVALFTVCGAASAQTKFDVTVGGDLYFKGAYVKEDNDEGLRSTDFANRFRLVITPTAKADNGLEYGARLRLRANNGDGTVDADRAFMFVNGAFGTIQAGTINGLSDEYGVIGPAIEGISGGPDDGAVDFAGTSAGGRNYIPGTSTNFRTTASGDTSTKVIYLTPSFSGFQAGVSYAPQLGSYNASVDRNKTAPNLLGVEDVVEVGGLYSGEFGDITVAASGFYEFGRASGTKDYRSWTVGASVGYGPAEIGGFYTDQGRSGYVTGTGREQRAWSINGTYTMGPVILAASYLNAREDTSFGAGGPNVDFDLWEAGMTYTVAPGLTVGVEYNYYDSELSAPAPGVSEGKGHIVMVDTRLAF